MEEKKIVISIPDSDLLKKANLSQDELELLVENMFRSVDNPGYTSVVIQGGVQEGTSQDHPTWERTDWSRAC